MNMPTNIYLPIPFEEYREIETSRTTKDCEERWRWMKKIILQDRRSLSGLFMIEIGCANGYFPFRFIQDGGARVFGVERDKDLRQLANDLAKQFKMDFSAVSAIKELLQRDRYDIGLYLELHYHEGINCLPWLAAHVDMLFCSPAGDGNKHNEPFYDELKRFFKSVSQIGVTIANRAMFVCTDPIVQATPSHRAPAEYSEPADAEPMAPSAQVQEEAPAQQPKPKKPKKIAKEETSV